MESRTVSLASLDVGGLVATQPCLVCGRQPSEAHHLKFSQPSALGRKVSDAFIVPLCALLHRDLHTAGNELAWWERKQIDPMVTANMLWDASHGREHPEARDGSQHATKICPVKCIEHVWIILRA